MLILKRRVPSPELTDATFRPSSSTVLPSIYVWSLFPSSSNSNRYFTSIRNKNLVNSHRLYCASIESIDLNLSLFRQLGSDLRMFSFIELVTCINSRGKESKDHCERTIQ